MATTTLVISGNKSGEKCRSLETSAPKPTATQKRRLNLQNPYADKPGSSVATTSAPTDPNARPGDPNAQPGDPNAGVQPGDPNAQLGGSNAHPGDPDVQPGESNAQPGESNAQPGDPDAQPGELNAHPGESNAHPGESNAPPARPNTDTSVSAEEAEGLPEGGASMSKRSQGKLVEMPKDVRTAKQLFQKEQFEMGNVTNSQFRKMWKDMSDDMKKVR
ncbi:hypothetical protein OE88DRAFT_1645184 [Heliocybe sulcata]|uniref:Uncharacterized protein n=1 Tax=Heliocybe sulcata TaxID=5364 RepID=A0A5C3N171_9AGAM|nr:hypothetical protein OE88DRAFT_1645184 [Heliocybe sulcata]